MALQWRIQYRSYVSYMVLWVIVSIISGVDNLPFDSTGIQSILPVAVGESVEYYRLIREANEEAIELSTTTEQKSTVEKLDKELNNDKTNTNNTFKENDQGYDHEDHTKMKQHNKQYKYLGNNFKNFSTNRVKVESGLFSTNTNESFNDKPKSNLYSVSKYSNLNKKNMKFNTNYTDGLVKVNHSKILDPNEDKPKAQLYSGPFNVTKPGDDIQEMGDQPAEVYGNTTDFIDDESLVQNSSLHTETHNTTSADSRIMPALEGFDILIICSIILGTILLLGLIGGSGYVVYRHRIWNKPQTLSDKCSNADSSGYIDDSTLRENSEEMYSLDNDSFLNSLEAMTIQNYWTDNVKHTKL